MTSDTGKKIKPTAFDGPMSREANRKHTTAPAIKRPENVLQKLLASPVA
jgi:hypothetical protein